MVIEIYEGLKFGQMTVLGLNEEKMLETKTKGKYEKIYDCQCSCGKIKQLTVSSIRSSIKNNVDSSCGLCYTFEDWCLDHNHQDWVDLWDYELNDKKPSEVGYSSGKKYWFKCESAIHPSETYILNKLTRKDHGSNVSCRRCRSFGYYLEIHNIMSLWSKNNTIDPYSIARCNEGKVFIKCQNPKHEDYVVSPTNFTRGDKTVTKTL